MAEVRRRKNESIDDLLKRFRRKVDREGIMNDFKRHESFSKKKKKSGKK